MAFDMREATPDRWILAMLVLLCFALGAVIPLLLVILREWPSAGESRRREQVLLRLGEARGRQAVIDEVRMLEHGQLKTHVLAVQRCLILARDATSREQRIHWIDAGVDQARRLLEVVVMLHQSVGTSALPNDLERAVTDVAQSLAVAYPACCCLVEVNGCRPAAIRDSVQRALMLVLYNALNNAYVHGRPSQVMVQLQYAPDELILVVDDDGQGMMPVSHGNGRGLRDIRELVIAHGGTLRIASEPGAGTQMRVSFPLDGADTEREEGRNATYSVSPFART